MALFDADYLRATFPIASDFPLGPITESIALASATVKKFVGSDAYSDASAETPADDQAAIFIKAGEARVALYYLLLNAQAGTVRRQGIAKKEQDAAGPMGGTVINEYYTPADLRSLREQFAEEALSFLAEYRDDDAVFIIDAGGIEVGTMRSADIEPDLYPISIDYLSGRY